MVVNTKKEMIKKVDFIIFCFHKFSFFLGEMKSKKIDRIKYKR